MAESNPLMFPACLIPSKKQSSSNRMFTLYNVSSGILARMLHILQMNNKIGVCAVLSVEEVAISLESKV